MTDFDFEALETLWVATVDKVLAPFAKKKETFYALAFHTGYAEQGAAISPPALAIQSVEAHAEGGDEGLRWSPPDWSEPEIELPPKVSTLYDALTAAATATESTRDWDRVYARYVRAMFRTAKTLGTRARKGEGVFARLRLAPDFIVFVHDDDHGLDGVKRSVPAAMFARLFPGHEPARRARAEVLDKAPTDRARALVASFADEDAPVGWEDAQEQLVRLGAEAVPALTAGLTHPTTGWMCASTLAKMGSPAAAPATQSLLDAVQNATDAAMWSARALGRLGCFAELEALLHEPTTAENALGGLADGRPASYPHLERVLDAGDRKLIAIVADDLQPGRPGPAPTPADLDAIVSAARSRHVIIRKDAAIALGESGLGEKNRARAVPILVDLLGDAESEVRRLAALSLADCGRKHARSAAPALQRLAKEDRVKAVRDTAASALRKLT